MKKPASILIVDDDSDLALMLKEILEYKGYEASIIVHVEQIEDIIVANYDLVLLDMLLSGTDGKDICAYLKKNKPGSVPPIMMMSAHPNAKEACINAGADDFISKPFEIEDLLDKISRLLNKKQQN